MTRCQSTDAGLLDAAEMQANGSPPEELKKIIQERYKDTLLQSPERARCFIHAVSNP